mgnify:CR=1 FL=1
MLRRKGVKWKINELFSSSSYDQIFAENRVNLFWNFENDENYKFIITLFAAASAKQFEPIKWEPCDKEWIIVNYPILSKSKNEKFQFEHNLRKLDFQRIRHSADGMISYFHPDFNFNYKLEISRLVNGRRKCKQSSPATLTTCDLTKV